MKKFKLETILTIVTGVNLTDNFNEVYELAMYIYDDTFINTSAILLLKEEIKSHILNDHPELKNIDYVPVSPFAKVAWLKELKQIYGETLLISKIGEILTKNKTK